VVAEKAERRKKSKARPKSDSFFFAGGPGDGRLEKRNAAQRHKRRSPEKGGMKIKGVEKG